MLNDVVGQSEAIHLLKRVVEGQLVNPLLLVGDEGVGRRFSVLEAVKEIVASARGGPGCPECVQINQGVHPDVVTVTAPGEKDIGIEAVRSVLEQCNNHPTASPFQFYIIDGADRLTGPAANAILKTLEEPPSYARFFLLSETYDRVLPTIRSRCGRVPYRRLPESFIVSKIMTFEGDADKALVYARMGEGSVGRAARYCGANRLSLRDRVLTFVDAGVRGDTSSMLSGIDEVSQELELAFKFLRFLSHDLLVGHIDPSRVINIDVVSDVASMRKRRPETTWRQLWEELKTLQKRHETSYLNLSFHVKTALISAFHGE